MTASLTVNFDCLYYIDWINMLGLNREKHLMISDNFEAKWRKKLTTEKFGLSNFQSQIWIEIVVRVIVVLTIFKRSNLQV